MQKIPMRKICKTDENPRRWILPRAKNRFQNGSQVATLSQGYTNSDLWDSMTNENLKLTTYA